MVETVIVAAAVFAIGFGCGFFIRGLEPPPEDRSWPVVEDGPPPPGTQIDRSPQAWWRTDTNK